MPEKTSFIARASIVGAFVAAAFASTSAIAQIQTQAPALRINVGCPSVVSATMCDTIKRIHYMLQEQNVLPGSPLDGVRPPIPRDELAKLESLVQRAVGDIQRIAKTQQGKMTEAEFDKAMLEKSKAAGTPQNVLGAVTAAGGPSRVFANAEKTLDQMMRDMRSELKISANESDQAVIEKLLAVLTLSGNADARLRGLGCSLAMYVLTMGQGTDANYKLCMR